MLTADTDRLGGHVAWWACPAGRWLAVRVETPGGRTDWTDAEDYAHGESWRHGEWVYLAESDADHFLPAAGLAEVDVPTRPRQRRPDGWLATRDEDAARIAAGDPDAMAAWCAEHDSRDAEDEVLAWLASAPPPDAPPVEPLEVVRELVSAAASTGRAPRMTKSARREHNRRLAAEVRALGLIPNGTVWERAKTIAAAGRPLNREELIA